MTIITMLATPSGPLGRELCDALISLPSSTQGEQNMMSEDQLLFEELQGRQRPAAGHDLA